MSAPRLAIVTGGSRGLGLALLEAYEEAGYRTVDVSRSGASDASKGRSHVRADLGDPIAATDALTREFEELAQHEYEEVVLVSNAGTLEPIGPLANSTPAEWRANLDVNLTSAIGAMALFAGAFDGHACRKVIVSISSGAGSRGVAGWSLYCAAKAGVDNWVRAFALEQEHEEHPIHAVSIQPGVVDTEMQAAIRATDPNLFPDHPRFVELKEHGALADPATVAGAIRRIAEGAFTPGELLRVDL